MSKTKKLDIFNLFYSGAAVVILIGVIAKLLEWPAQDLLITGGLAIEAVVFEDIDETDKQSDTEQEPGKITIGASNESDTSSYLFILVDGKAVKKPVERKTPLSKPGSTGFNQKTMEKSKPFYSGTGGEY